MHPTTRLLSGSAHKPLIRFLGPRKWPSSPEPPHPHPGAPAEIRNAFDAFVKKIQASASAPKDTTSKSGGKEAFGEFWEAPSRFWQPKVRQLEDAEIEAITSGGASLF